MPTNNKRKSRLGLTLALGAAALIVVFAAAYYWPFYTYRRDVARIQARNVDLTQVADGQYVGRCDVGILAATVRIAVRDHRIVDLELIEHKHERGQSANVVADAIFVEQRIDVDAVTGATNSSKVIREAAYNALTGAHTY